MIPFSCGHCGNDLEVSDQLAGDSVQCPRCRQPAAVPQLAVRSNSPPAFAKQRADPEKTLPRKAPPDPEAPTVAKTGGQVGDGNDSAGGQTGVAAIGKGEAAREFRAPPVPRYDFLAPPEKPDEIGRLGPYRVLEVLGAGGMGVVFKALDPGLQRLVALKAMLPSQASDPSAKERFFREARAAAALKHPHIVGIYYVGEDRGTPFLAMEFLEGEPLDARLKREASLSVADLLHIGAQIADGLAAAHSKGLIHRDIKPANIWLESVVRSPSSVAKESTPASATDHGLRTTDCSVKILDFGLARAQADRTQLTQQGAIVGTPAYMAPEQAGGRRVDHRSDLFSLGCVLYRMATGTLAFRGGDTIAILSAIALETPAPPSELNLEIPPELSDLIMSLLAKKPEDRPLSAQEVARALKEMETYGHRPVEPRLKRDVTAIRATESEETTILPKPVAQRKKWPLLAGAGVLLVALAVSAYFAFFADSKPPPDGPAQPQQPAALPPVFASSLGMEFVLIPKGKSWLGGGGGKPGAKGVHITHDFYLGKYEVTQEEWQKVMGNNPSYFSRAGGGRGDVQGIPDAELRRFPVEQVSWDDAQTFLERLNAKDGTEGWVYRLPREAEWEYACRGGPIEKLASAFDFYVDEPGNILLAGQANFGLKRTCKVGSYPPNALGLCDMHGNVGEWCDSARPGVDAGPDRVDRGGRWGVPADFCRAASRYVDPRGTRSMGIGLRLARVPAGTEIVKLLPEPEKPPVETKLTPKFAKNLGMEFVLVPKGKSWLGGGGGKPGTRAVEIPHDFFLGKYEVTQEEWEKVMGSNPSFFNMPIDKRDKRRFPVEQVSWNDAQELIKRLNGQAEAGWLYRLPTEVEWEYACRGGPMTDPSESAFDFYVEKPANELLGTQANFMYLLGMQKGTVKVGSYPPNRLGLHDMHGNVWEWCESAETGPDGGTRRVARGGAWYNGPGRMFLRATERAIQAPTHRDSGIGLRLARVPAGKAGK
jgi:formylglycine-generating enzyme required for sulfatase activity